jgi:hypothetical protein
MNEVSEVSTPWEALLRDIRENRELDVIDLSDSKLALYDFSNALRMHSLGERLTDTLRTAWIRPSHAYYKVTFGCKFFATMNEQQQQSFFRTIFALPVGIVEVGDATNNGVEKPVITIHTLALLDALANLNSSVWSLRVGNFALSNQSEVEALSNIILAKRDTLRQIYLEGIECPANSNQRDRDGQIGILDPLLYASSRLETWYALELSARTPPSHSCLVTPNAVRALFGEERRLNFLHLHGLGLNNSHCDAIAEALQEGHTSVGRLSFESNPAISAQGFAALLGLINRANVIDRFFLDKKRWEAELNLVSVMNRKHGRLEYMMNGTFSSEERRWQWLQKLAAMEGTDEEEFAARHINYLWYTVRENPEVVQT